MSLEGANFLTFLTLTAIGVGAASLTTVGALFVVARHFLADLTRPGVTIQAGEPFWSDWGFPQDEVEPPLAMQRPLHFSAPGGPELRGDFWAQPHPAPTIILSHGFHVPSVHMRSVAALEYRYGCNVLLFDYRGHGESAAVPTSGGNAEVADLTAAVDLALQQPETVPGKLFIHGFSMGAAVALLMPTRPEIGGIIADSAYARLDVVLHEMIYQHLAGVTQGWSRPWRSLRRGLPLLARVVLVSGRSLFRLRFHRGLIARPVVSLRRVQAALTQLPSLKTIPLLLIHSRRDPFVTIAHAHELADAAKTSQVPLTTYYADTAVHCGAFGYNPQRYMTLLCQFLGLSQP
jgi:uncharacterized protein